MLQRDIQLFITSESKISPFQMLYGAKASPRLQDGPAKLGLSKIRTQTFPITPPGSNTTDGRYLESRATAGRIGPQADLCPALRFIPPATVGPRITQRPAHTRLSPRKSHGADAKTQLVCLHVYFACMFFPAHSHLFSQTAFSPQDQNSSHGSSSPPLFGSGASDSAWHIPGGTSFW
jgi:hypothetical protein